MHDSYLYSYQSPITPLQLFSEHFADSNLIHLRGVKLYYTQRGIVVRSTFSLCLLLLEFALQRENKSCFIFLGALQSPWHLFKMRLKRRAAVKKKKKANFSVTYWVIESLRAQWPALVKNIGRVYPILNDKKVHNMGNSTHCVHWNTIGFGFMIYFYQQTHLRVREFSVFFLFAMWVFYTVFLCVAHHRVFRARGIFLVLLWVMFLIWIIHPRETRL